MSNEKFTDPALDAMDDNLLDFDDDPLSATGVSRKSLVIFFLIDTSGSMKGKKMGELNTVMEELIPEMSEGEHSNIGTVFFAVGFTLMMVLDVALG